MLLSNYTAGDQTGLQTMSVTEISWGLILPHPNPQGFAMGPRGGRHRAGVDTNKLCEAPRDAVGLDVEK